MLNQEPLEMRDAKPREMVIKKHGRPKNGDTWEMVIKNGRPINDTVTFIYNWWKLLRIMN